MLIESCWVALGRFGSRCNLLHPGRKFLYFLSGEAGYRYGAKVVAVRTGDWLPFERTARQGIKAIEVFPVSCLLVAFTLRE